MASRTSLWTEGRQNSDVSGTLDAGGTFFMPNATFTMQSPATFTPRDAQFISRKLTMRQGLLRMQPTAENTVTAPFLAGVDLVR